MQSSIIFAAIAAALQSASAVKCYQGLVYYMADGTVDVEYMLMTNYQESKGCVRLTTICSTSRCDKPGAVKIESYSDAGGECKSWMNGSSKQHVFECVERDFSFIPPQAEKARKLGNWDGNPPTVGQSPSPISAPGAGSSAVAPTSPGSSTGSNAVGGVSAVPAGVNSGVNAGVNAGQPAKDGSAEPSTSDASSLAASMAIGFVPAIASLFF